MSPHIYIYNDGDIAEGLTLREWAARHPRSRSRWSRFVRWLNGRPS